MKHFNDTTCNPITLHYYQLENGTFDLGEIMRSLKPLKRLSRGSQPH